MPEAGADLDRDQDRDSTPVEEHVHADVPQCSSLADRKRVRAKGISSRPSGDPSDKKPKGASHIRAV